MKGTRPNNRLLRRLCTLALLVLCLTGAMLKGWRHGEKAAHHNEHMRSPVARLSHEWLEHYSEDNVGCDLGRGSYTWRLCGFGSNVNNMLDAWLYALVVKEWRDIALIYDPSLLGYVNCSVESGGRVAQGWNCLFDDMPHVCTFDTAENWTQHMAARRVSDEVQQEATELTITAVRRSTHIDASLKGSGVDRISAVAVLARYLWSHMAPWLRDDVFTVTQAHETFQRSPFVGIHVRRGDKVSEGKAELIQVEKKVYVHVLCGTKCLEMCVRRTILQPFVSPTENKLVQGITNYQDYLSTAVDYLKADNNRTRVDEIRGLWVASDDSAVISEVRALAHSYFPGVSNESIVYAGQGMLGGAENTGLVTSTDKQGYGSFVYLFADLHQLAAADVFVGTYSSNIGKLVAVLREVLHKDRTTSISMEGHRWSPGRRQHRV